MMTFSGKTIIKNQRAFCIVVAITSFILAISGCESTPRYIVQPDEDLSPGQRILPANDPTNQSPSVVSRLKKSALLVQPEFFECNLVETPSFNVIVQNLSDKPLEISTSNFHISHGAEASFRVLNKEEMRRFIEERAAEQKRDMLIIGLIGSVSEFYNAKVTGSMYTGSFLASTMTLPSYIDEQAMTDLDKYRGHILEPKVVMPGERHGGLIVGKAIGKASSYSFKEEFAHVPMTVWFGVGGVGDESHLIEFVCRSEATKM